ncbi:hypothetical protein AB0L74_08620 [Streptomyces sp. NPDC052020]|uniref:hypothetical protein n=1 Tax=Streptomyces sp. NPDC052020 TaxID=3155677 RepID=UPI00344AE1EC
MTTRSIAPPASDARDRVQAVWSRYLRRGDRATVRGRAYTVYLVALFAVFYLVPVLHAASTSPGLFPEVSAAASCGIAVVTCWGAQLAGRFWGPLVLQPFLLHVFISTDMSPASYLGRIARRRLVYAGAATLLAACTAAYLTTDLFDRLGTGLPGLAVAAGLSALASVAWLWGQVRGVPDNVAVACAAGVLAPAVTAASGTAPGGSGGLWLVAGVLVTAAAALGRAAFRSIPALDLARLARESARASQAQTYALTGTLHHALDLYRPEPRGLTSALIRPDGRLRGYLAQGAVRALRTPGRAVAAAVLLPAGGGLLALGAAGAEGSPTLPLCLAGSVSVYLGSGWASETWRGLRDELTLPPLFGGGMLSRTLAWPLVAVPAGACLGGGLVILALLPLPGGRLAATGLFFAGVLVLVLGARFLREMKLHLPLGLLLPVITPFGDLSGVLLVAWQFDGVVAVAIGVAVTHAAPSALGAAGLAAAAAACCVWLGLRRTGWARRGLLSRLRRS